MLGCRVWAEPVAALLWGNGKSPTRKPRAAAFGSQPSREASYAIRRAAEARYSSRPGESACRGERLAEPVAEEVARVSIRALRSAPVVWSPQRTLRQAGA